MPSSTDEIDRYSDAVDVARRYQRLERPLSSAVALLVGLVVGAAFILFSLIEAVLVGLVLGALVRVPVFRTSGTARLVTDADPGAVRAEFEGETPPPLAFQWGVADDVRSTDDGVTYEFSYLFGLRSTEMTVETRVNAPDAGGDDDTLELVVTAGGRSWATYTVSIQRGGDDTVVDVEWASDRRFGLRRLPQQFVADRYRADAFAVQGYRVADRETSLSL
jgi:hypothetical protein